MAGRRTRVPDKELAEFFEKHAGDMSLWETKPKPIRVRRGGPSHTFSVRFAPDELELLDKAADERGITISELIRSAALAAVKDEHAATLEEVRQKTKDLARTVSRL
jgi:hypothetical protein